MPWRLLFALVVSATGTLRGHVSIRKQGGDDKRDYGEAVLYIADVSAPVSGVRAEIRQKEQRFLPRVLAVAAGTTVWFPNDDPEEHNVFSHSASADFDLGRFARGPGKSRTFSSPGVIEIFCNVHKAMVAYAVVAPSRLFAITGADGSFRIDGVPAGRHTVALWERFARPRLTTFTVDVPPGGTATVERTVVEGVAAEPDHKNKFGVTYPEGYH
jgi:plastocyanin